MKSLVAVLGAVLLLNFPTYAQQQVTSPRDAATSGTLTTITTDTVPLAISGSQWATVQFVATVAGTSTVTAQYSKDGTNWIAAPYATRLSTAAANPTTQAISATTLVANDVWEIPLPGNTVKFQLLCAATGTTTSVVVRAGLPYVPGTPVVATLFDVTSGVNTDNPTSTLDFSGWSSSYQTFSSGGATTASLLASHVADDGVVVGGAFTLVAASTAGQMSITRTTSASGANMLTRRMIFDIQPVVAQQSRLRVEAYR